MLICGRLFSARGSVSSVLICGRLFSARSFCAFRAFCGNIFSPTEFTEFTEFVSVCIAGMPYPPTSVRIRAHLWEALLCQKFLCVPCVLWEYLFSHGFHRLTQILRVRCSPTEFTEFGSVGMAGVPYPPTSVLICAICGSPFSARGSVYSVHSVGASSPFVRLVQQRLLHPLAESTEVVHKSHHLTISPPHHLTTTTSFHLEPSLLHVLPVLWVRLRHHLRLVDAQPGEHDCRRCERHRHAVVVVRVDRL